ncbi:Dbl homology domain-containing protein [Dendrothele bispora CBS 962.96]|uniref:Dbl homology domain-containing protein n=1 Tax=Dendrothele bispora (strain CBS 962.96) TaxID=1314807 RepID=A0A4S8MYC7_DENBC|nr:Dbl homology domain-containing protein [Dendrothele bispora CBS 962.96]
MANVTVKVSESFPEPTPSRISRRPTINGFLPLPPISASPVCTPTTSSSSHDFAMYSGDDHQPSSRSLSVESFNTAPTTPSDNSCNRFLLPPTWISTPPTPPPKLVRRSVTCVTRRPNSYISSSTSFPHASKSPRAQAKYSPKRRASVPSMSSVSRTRSSSLSAALTSPTRQVPSIQPLEPMVLNSPLRSKYNHSRNSLSPSVFIPGSKPIPFDVAHQVSSDDDPLDIPAFKSDQGTDVQPSASMSGRSSTKDDTRRFHALMELLTTEVAYLLDLKILVSVYLRHIPALKRSSISSAFSRNASFTALSASGTSYAPLGGGVPMVLVIDQPSPATLIQREREKNVVRHLLTDSEVDTLTRNAEEMLQFHEQFVEELKLAMTPLGFPVELITRDWESIISPDKYREGIGNVDAGIAIVSTKFATESSRFTSYETFCAGHPEALDIVRRVQQQHPTEWEVFELTSSSTASDMLGALHPPSNMTSASHETLPSKIMDDAGSIASVRSTKRRRRASIASLTSLDNVPWSGRVRSHSANGVARDSVVVDSSRSKSRLAFMDYLIKPVQRICKYPLLLDQLKKKGTSAVPKSLVGRTDVNVVVESAAQAMRHVASAVDDARRRQDTKVKSSLIISRMSFQPVSPSFFSSSTPHPPLQVLTPPFMSSLGMCYMAGSLDVIHHRPTKAHSHTTNISVKYMAAFLYQGGYLILAKVLKGKTYEPRHWFNLTEFQVRDPGEGEAWLPCSFRLSCMGHEFELAAACQQEKDVWMNAIREALLYPESSWVQEPVSSLKADGKGELIPSGLDGPFEAINSLPTIQSVSSLTKDHDIEPEQISPEAVMVETNFPSSSTHRAMPSRRSSSTSTKAGFTPISTDSDTVIIKRPILSSRNTVDQGLQDVISELCSTARSQAISREQELFQPPHVTQLGSTSRPPTSSGTTKSRLKKHESVRVSRCKSFADSDEIRRGLKEAIRTRSLSAKKLPHRPNTIASNSADSASFPFIQSPVSTPPFSRPSSIAPTSNPNSGANSPTEKSALVPLAMPSVDGLEYRSRPASLVGSVRGLLVPASKASTSTLLTMTPMTPVSASAEDHSTSQLRSSASRFFKRWVRGGGPSQSHRRSNSAPENESTEQEGQEVSPTLPELPQSWRSTAVAIDQVS